MVGTFTHIDDTGNVKMVDVTSKESTFREAHAEGCVRMSSDVVNCIVDGKVPKGNVFETARIAGIMGAKRTWSLIPLCHQLQITNVSIDLSVDANLPGIRIKAAVKTRDRTGVEMEALTAVSIAALTIYDMCKALDKTMTIDQIQLVYKSGGKSGIFVRDNRPVPGSQTETSHQG